MGSSCPECAKNGIRARIKAFQINLKEAVWACEREEVNNLVLLSFFICSPIFPLHLTVLFVFQCSWPIGYEELIFFDRDAASCNWDEPSLVKEDTPTLMELSLYTPPVTPGEELSKELTETASMEYSSNSPWRMEDKLGRTLPKQESFGSNKPPLFETLELERINSTEEHRNIMKEQTANVSICKTLPKIINIEKTNINLTVVSNVGKHGNTKTQSLLTDAIVMDPFKNFDMSDSVCTEFGLSMQYDTESEQSKSDKLHSDATMSGMKTNFDAEALSETTKTLVDVNITNNLNTSNESVSNISLGDINIDALLQDVLNSQEMNDSVEMNDWLSELMS